MACLQTSATEICVIGPTPKPRWRRPVVPPLAWTLAIATLLLVLLLHPQLSRARIMWALDEDNAGYLIWVFPITIAVNIAVAAAFVFHDPRTPFVKVATAWLGVFVAVNCAAIIM